MKRVRAGLIALPLLAVALSACAVGPVSGYVYTQTKFAGEINPHGAIARAKTARGCLVSLFWLFSFGDASAGNIARRAGIERIAAIDYSILSYAGLTFARYCTIVTGE